MFVRRLAFGAVIVLATAAVDAALYRWVDENGRVQYSDRPPQKDRSAVQLSNRGMVLKKIDGALSPEQQKAKEADEARKRAEDAKALEQRRQDSALLQSFTTVQEIDLKRDREVHAVEIAIANLREQERTLGARLAEDRKRAEVLDKGKKPMPEALKEDILRAEAEKRVLEEEIKRRYDEIGTTKSRYEALKKRYILLRQEAALIEPASAVSPAAAKK